MRIGLSSCCRVDEGLVCTGSADELVSSLASSTPGSRY